MKNIISNVIDSLRRVIKKIMLVSEEATERQSQVSSEEPIVPMQIPKQPSTEIGMSLFRDARDGKEYKTVNIGGQTWMAENFNYDVLSSKCYDNDPKNAEKYGRLYDWETAMKIAPPGWHLPSYKEWKRLEHFTGESYYIAKKLKAKNGWNEPSNGTDEYGFSALPCGHWVKDGFSGIGEWCNWWSSTITDDNTYSAEIWGIGFIGCDAPEDKTHLLSVRYLKDSDPLLDSRDGKEYKTVKIGGQVWMAENLNYDIPGSKCYDNDPKNAEKYGRLYDWETAMKIAPPGWHLPSDKEWKRLVKIMVIETLDGYSEEEAGDMLKAETCWKDQDSNFWDDCKSVAAYRDLYGFSALPGGCGYFIDHYGTCVYSGVNEDGWWWSSNNTDYFNASTWNIGFHRGDVFQDNRGKNELFSVRCVKD